MDAADKLVRKLIDSGLLGPDEANALRESSATGAADDAADDAARRFSETLIAEGVVTPFQLEAVQSDSPAQLVIGDYELLEEVGQGGMGVVYKGRHRRMNRLVAIKKITPAHNTDGSVLQRFEREVEVSAVLRHPNIVLAFDAREEDGDLYLITEFVEGQSLQQIVDDSGPLPAADAVECIVQAAQGLLHAHQSGIIHRDIKPANLMLSSDGEVKILDLGLARSDAESRPATSRGRFQLTGAGSVIGTPDYMAPEQATDSRSVDHRADIYALGCTLCFLITGRPLFSGPSVIDVLLAHRDQPPPTLSSRCPGVSGELDAICQRMVSKEPDERFDSMAEVISALQRIGSPASDPPGEMSEPGETLAVSTSATLAERDREPDIQPAVAEAPVAPIRRHLPRMTALLLCGRLIGLVTGVSAGARLNGAMGGVLLLLAIPWFLWIGWRFGRGYAGIVGTLLGWTNRPLEQMGGPEFSPEWVRVNVGSALGGGILGALAGDTLAGVFVGLTLFLVTRAVVQARIDRGPDQTRR